MGNLAAYHEASLVVRLAGHHEGVVHIAGDAVQVLIPGAAITVADKNSTIVLYKAWIEARLIARKLLTSHEGARSYRTPKPEILATVNYGGERVPAPHVMGKAPAHSPSGCGQIAVQIGRFTIVCDDRAAWLSQDRIWTDMYECATQIWPLWPLDSAYYMYQSRIAERLFEQGR